MLYNLDPTLIELVDIESIEKIHDVNGVDIEVAEDNTFTLASGILSHNSASKAIINCRNPKEHAIYPLRGKPLNVLKIDAKKLMENEIFKNILTITGLKLGEKVESISQLRFGKLVILTDADCVTGEHYTLTDTGEKLVSDVNIGDKVLTHTGQYKTVEYVNEQTKSQIMRIRSGDTIIECSPDHKQPVLRDGVVHIVLAKDILHTDMLLSKKKSSNENTV